MLDVVIVVIEVLGCAFHLILAFAPRPLPGRTHHPRRMTDATPPLATLREEIEKSIDRRRHHLPAWRCGRNRGPAHP